MFDISDLSLRARLAIALHLFAGYCRRLGLAHPEIDAFLNHLWTFISLPDSPGAFARWEADVSPLVAVAMGDEYPPTFELFFQGREVTEQEFRRVLSRTAEVVYGSFYGAADEPGSREFVLELLALVGPFGVPVPDTRLFAGSRWSDKHGWGTPLSEEELAAWRGA